MGNTLAHNLAEALDSVCVDVTLHASLVFKIETSPTPGVTKKLRQPPFAAAVVLAVAEALAAAFGNAEVEFLKSFLKSPLR